jgi:hypothetical protein
MQGDYVCDNNRNMKRSADNKGNDKSNSDVQHEKCAKSNENKSAEQRKKKQYFERRDHNNGSNQNLQSSPRRNNNRFHNRNYQNGNRQNRNNVHQYHHQNNHNQHHHNHQQQQYVNSNISKPDSNNNNLKNNSQYHNNNHHHANNNSSTNGAHHHQQQQQQSQQQPPPQQLPQMQTQAKSSCYNANNNHNNYNKSSTPKIMLNSQTQCDIKPEAVPNVNGNNHSQLQAQLHQQSHPKSRMNSNNNASNCNASNVSAKNVVSNVNTKNNAINVNAKHNMSHANCNQQNYVLKPVISPSSVESNSSSKVSSFGSSGDNATNETHRNVKNSYNNSNNNMHHYYQQNHRNNYNYQQQQQNHHFHHYAMMNGSGDCYTSNAHDLYRKYSVEFLSKNEHSHYTSPPNMMKNPKTLDEFYAIKVALGDNVGYYQQIHNGMPFNNQFVLQPQQQQQQFQQNFVQYQNMQQRQMFMQRPENNNIIPRFHPQQNTPNRVYNANVNVDQSQVRHHVNTHQLPHPDLQRNGMFPFGFYQQQPPPNFIAQHQQQQQQAAMFHHHQQHASQQHSQTPQMPSQHQVHNNNNNSNNSNNSGNPNLLFQNRSKQRDNFNNRKNYRNYHHHNNSNNNNNNNNNNSNFNGNRKANNQKQVTVQPAKQQLQQSTAVNKPISVEIDPNTRNVNLATLHTLDSPKTADVFERYSSTPPSSVQSMSPNLEKMGERLRRLTESGDENVDSDTSTAMSFFSDPIRPTQCLTPMVLTPTENTMNSWIHGNNGNNFTFMNTGLSTSADQLNLRSFCGTPITFVKRPPSIHNIPIYNQNLNHSYSHSNIHRPQPIINRYPHSLLSRSAPAGINYSNIAFDPTYPFDYYLARANASVMRNEPAELVCGSVWDVASSQIWVKFQKCQQTRETYTRKMLLWRDIYECIKVRRKISLHSKI